jgi:hypothetical protein
MMSGVHATVTRRLPARDDSQSSARVRASSAIRCARTACPTGTATYTIAKAAAIHGVRAHHRAGPGRRCTQDAIASVAARIVNPNPTHSTGSVTR